MNKIIKSDEEYNLALVELEALIDEDPKQGSPEGERLEFLSLLVEDYESRKYGQTLPDPIEAIQFRMEQQGLAQKDLVPYVGSRSKVSEVLAHKRPLTLSMIRALHSGLGIPAKVLVQERPLRDIQEPDLEWSRFPIKEMIARGWIQAKFATTPEAFIKGFFAQLGSASAARALYRTTHHTRSGRTMDHYALTAWTARVIIRVRQNPPPVSYVKGTVSLQFMRELARLSVFDRGPLLAQEFLWKHGIPLIVESHLPKTYLDGAAILGEAERPVIGVTLRHDRLDNFWFCLMHELAHVALHLGQGISQFFDDLDTSVGIDPREKEADDLAGEALVPQAEWERSPASHLRTPEAVMQLANQLRIHPSVVAGRIRRKFKNYRVLNRFVGYGKVRASLQEINKQG